MPSIDRLVFVALFSISGAVLCSCSDKQAAAPGKGSGSATAAAGSPGTTASGAKTAAGPGATSTGTGSGTGTGTSRVAAAGGAGATQTAGTGAAMPVDPAELPRLAPPAGTTATTATTGPAKRDCTPADWKDPGTVPNPKVVAVAADAGKTGQMFGKSVGFEESGYVEEEFLYTGTTPAYTSRMVVHRPKDAAKFSGTVFLEWYNVTGGIDMGVMWALNREYFVREGHVHIGVSAQQVGASALKDYDAERYAAINHPGDTAANTIFSQAAMAVRSQTDLVLGPCMPVRTVLAGGQSQSSAYLAGYVDTAQPKDQMYDGFLLHSGGTPKGNPPVPTFLVFTLAEADGKLVDLPNVHEWEVAGASHSDAYVSARGQVEQGTAVMIQTKCAGKMNEFPSFMVYNAAIDGLNKWVQKGTRPPNADPVQPGKMDEYGNALGGVRIQDIEVPIAVHGTAPAVAADPFDFLSLFVCGAGGSSVPFTEEKLLKLYPTHDDYVQKYTRAADKALASGYILQADHDSAIKWAKSAPIPN
jgi:hypothetical protein